MENDNLTVINEIEKLGYGAAPYSSQLKSNVIDLMSKFESFCGQSLDHKQNMLYQSSMGYENRDRLADPTSVDHKESFYIKNNYEFPKTFTPSEVDKEFVLGCKFLLKEILPLVLNSTAILSDVGGNDLSQYFDETSLTLRAIHYYPDTSVEIAYHHVDRGGHTYHLYETTDGLEAYWQGTWNKIMFDQGQMAYFPGLQAQFASKCLLKGLCHRVISNTQSVQHGRYSLVLFIDYHRLGYKYSLNKSGPVEKAFLPGQNYEIPFIELRDFFEERKH